MFFSFSSMRLRAVLECVSKMPCKVLADIGTDHAYLSIEAVRKNICERAIACDIASGPLQIAAKNIRAADLNGRIETRLGDGLQPLSLNEADCIVIAGMGGMNIIGIISDSFEKIGTARLILQAQHDLEELRRFLHKNLFNISKEKLVCEKSKKQQRFYVIMVARRVASQEEITPYTDAEYFTGKMYGEEFTAFLSEKHTKIKRYIDSISDQDSRELAQKRLAWLEGK